MKKIVLICATALAFIFGSCNSVHITFRPGVEMPDSIHTCLVESAENYYKFFGIEKELRIVDTTMSPVPRIYYLDENTKITSDALVLAMGSPQEIMINNYFFKSEACTIPRASGVFDHELFHTLHSNTMTVFSSDERLKFNGLCCYTGSLEVVQLEESAAEACANAVFDGKYHFAEPYWGMASVMVNMVDSGFFSVYDLVSFSKNNDVPGLVAKMLDKPRENVTTEDIVFVLTLFMRAEENDPFGQKSEGYKPYIAEVYKVRQQNAAQE